MTDRGQLPKDLDAERAVLGSILLEPAMMTEVAQLLAPGDFFDLAHREAYRIMGARHARGEPIDHTLVLTELDKVLDDGEAFALLSAAASSLEVTRHENALRKVPWRTTRGHPPAIFAVGFGQLPRP
ncbi:MAG: hypothetical protein A2W31_04425 [Planctomycetes bacterium RBG_16_64_10]|nr:MAG: hypothetical protein A2W31_04425 [Planctomycetes bacterium RBG_16_64_10]